MCDCLTKCILKGPYTPTIVTTPAVPATEDSPAVPEQTTVETVMNMTPGNYMAKIQEVPNADSSTDAEPLEQQSESISNTCAVETGDSNVIPDSPDMCDNDIQDDQNDVECDDERVALANLIANLKLDVDEKKDSKAIKESKCNIDSRIN
ncbi:hypothetical protein Tco_0090367 [Tanacetum coccineum]